MIKKLITVGIAMVLAMGMMAGCGEKGEDNPSSAGEPAKAADLEAETNTEQGSGSEDTKVALLLSGSANDNSWNQFGYEALMEVQEQLGTEVTFSENVTPAEQLSAMRDYASKGYDVVIGHGGQFEDDMIKAGPEFPDTQFVIICGANGTDPNVLAVDNAPWQYGYSYGWMAGNITKTNKIGFVTGMEGVATIYNLVASWRDAAKTVNPAVETTVIYIKDTNDVAAAREAAMSLKAAGCDVIMEELNAGVRGVIDVCKENNIYTLGRNASDVEYAPEQVLTCVDFDWAPKFVDMVKKVMEGEITGGTYFYGSDTPEAPGFIWRYNEENSWNPNVVTEDMMQGFQKEVVEMFQKEPFRKYTPEDAASGTK